MSATRDKPVWDDGEGPVFPVLEGKVRAEVCVVGLGGSGLVCLAELRDAGVDAVGLDAGAVGSGAAGRNGGLLLSGLADFHHRAAARLGRERATGLYRATLEQIERMAAETSAHVRIVGSLRIAASPEEESDCRAHFDALRADGLPAEWYEGDEGNGLLIPTDGVYQPLARCRLMARRLEGDGVRLFQDSAVHRIRKGEVSTLGGRVSCDRVIVAVDGGLERLLPELSGHVQTARIQALATAPETGVRCPRPVYSRWGYDFWQQLPDDRIVLGGARDIGGDDEWTARAEPTDTVQRALNYRLHRMGARARVTHRWAGIAGYTPDGLPVFEEVGDRILAVGGYSGTGNVLGAMLGREAAGWATDRELPLRHLLAAN